MADIIGTLEEYLPKMIFGTLILAAVVFGITSLLMPTLTAGLTSAVGLLFGIMLAAFFGLQARDHSTGGSKAVWELGLVIVLFVLAFGALGVPGLTTASVQIPQLSSFLSVISIGLVGAGIGLVIRTLGGLVNG